LRRKYIAHGTARLLARPVRPTAGLGARSNWTILPVAVFLPLVLLSERLVRVRSLGWYDVSIPELRARAAGSWSIRAGLQG
jgi:hypothetical protein